jgi:Flp pilus assembly protein TadD
MNAKAFRELLHSATRLHHAGHLDRAEQIYQQILSARPGQAEVVHLLGVIACQRQQFDRAVSLVSRAISSSPKESAYHNTLGNALRGLGDNRLTDAIAAYRRAVELDAGNLEALNNLALALDSADQTAEAVACFDRLIAARDNIAQWHANRGNVQINAAQADAAIASFRRALQLQPDFPQVRARLGMALLSKGEFAEGWPLNEWRFHTGIMPDPTAGDPSPRWNGEKLAGRTLLIRTEQGFGDSIQFVRYVRLIEKDGGKIVLQCQPALQRLFRSNMSDDEVIALGQAVPQHDLQIPILSLPLALWATVPTLPPQIPPINPGPEICDAWAARLPSRNGKLRIGIAWAGNPGHGNDRRRSCPANMFNTLYDIPNLEFHRLQLPSNLAPPSALTLIDPTDQLKDFADTAGLISQLDLVISVDTAIAHLAGAMGKPVWMLLPFAAEWRWMTGRVDTPWYPSARLFRQETSGDWTGVLQKVKSKFAAGLAASAASAGR